MSRRIAALLLTGLCLLGITSTLVSAPRGGATGKRVTPPKWDKVPEASLFSGNVFTDALVGDRPATLGSVPAGGVANTGGSDGGGGPSATEAAEYAWSKIISPEVIEDEIKRIKLALDEDVTTPTKFKGRGYSQARRHFSMIAVLFAIDSEYDGSIRWKDDAPAVRELFARAGYNCKAGTDQSFNEAKARKQDLEDLIGGSRLQTAKDAEAAPDWSRVSDRAPLMQRIETSHQGRLSKWTASKSEFEDNIEEVLHEAQLVAAIGEALKKEGMADAGDDDYDKFCDDMKNAALEIVNAVKLGNDEQARKASGAIGQACSGCHETYRG